MLLIVHSETVFLTKRRKKMSVLESSVNNDSFYVSPYSVCSPHSLDRDPLSTLSCQQQTCHRWHDKQQLTGKYSYTTVDVLM